MSICWPFEIVGRPPNTVELGKEKGEKEKTILFNSFFLRLHNNTTQCL